MKNLNYFNQCKTLDDVKREYKMLMEQWHPNIAPEGDSNIMKAVYDEYMAFATGPSFNKLSEEVRNDYTSFPELLKRLNSLNLKTELCGTWLWVSGDTKSHSEELKKHGLFYSAGKKMWYYRPRNSSGTNKKQMSMEYIRIKYGSDKESKEFAFGDKEVITAN